MTTETNNKPKQVSAFYIFAQDADGQSQRVGAAFRHGKGNGLTILIAEIRYVAFPPKSKSSPTTTETGA